MGYTHYWRQGQDFNQEGWAAICDATHKLIVALPATVKIAVEYDEPEGLPVVDGSEIRFNGIGDLGHETFLLERAARGFQFCKTARKPYDVLVCAVLMVAGTVAPDALSISSDGGEENWSAGLSLVKRTIDPEMQLPQSLQESLAA